MTVTEPGPLPGGPLSDEWGTEALRTRVAELLERARARTPRPHRGRRRGRPRRPALPVDVAAGLGPRARRQPGGAVAGARRRWSRAAAARDRRGSTTPSSTPRAEPADAAAARPGRGARVRAEVRDKALDALDRARCAADGWSEQGFAFGMIVQHEQQHDETMLATHQLRTGSPVLHAPPPARGGRRRAAAAEVLVPGGPFTMGTAPSRGRSTTSVPRTRRRPARLLDRHRPGHERRVRGVRRRGGYDDPRWWSARGLGAPASRPGLVAPQFWERDGDTWWRRRFGVLEPVPADEPVLHVCFFEAEAYARGRASGCPPRRSGRRPPASTPPPAARGVSRGATTSRRPRTRTSGSVTCSPPRWAPTRPGRRRWGCTR